MAKTILLTGAAGFIGFHLAKHLHARGDTVIGYDNFNDYYTPQLKKQRASLLQSEGIRVIEGDICHMDLLQQTVKENSFTHIVHLAAQAGVRYSIDNPQAYVSSNLQGFVNILEICRHIPHVKLVYASSSSVYGLNEKTPFSIDDPTDHPASLYGATKKANEVLAHSYHHLYGIPMTGLRFFTVYGPWGRPDMAYYSFSKAILEGKPIDVYNHGKMKRDFTYIDDIVQGTSAAIDLGASYDLFNLGNNEPQDLSCFIEVLECALGKKAQKNYLPMQPGDVLCTYADIDHTKEKLGFAPSTPLEKGIARFAQWYLDYATKE